ncbi:Uncharacterised protein [Legionella beliardensis]|uniref:Uncharacterized protein n=1 Tax=Legionella beliardensis TaxID=91822 RepID=A0A378I0G7_9GAMM|nr:hypothetical protein [Legionella beliardensis]STX28210.1 Uncharacterised protein [Legionella beliardensis]
MNSIIDNLKAFNVYINGGSSRALKKELKYYNNNLDELKINFHKTIIAHDEDVLEQVQALLTNLNIPKAQWPRYIKQKNIYQFLEKLNRRGFIQIVYILQLIDEKTQFSRIKLAGLSFGALSLGVGSLFIPELKGLRIALQSFILSVFSLPVLSLISKTISTAYYLYTNHSDKKKTSASRWQDNAFILAGFAVNVIGYLIWIILAGSVTPLMAALFLFASFLNVAKEIISLGQYAIKYKNREPIPTTDNLNIYRTYVRNEYNYFRQRNAVFIELVAAVLLVGVMAIGSFVPGGAVVTICTLLAIAAIALVKKFLLARNEKIIRERLQSQLEHVKEVEDKLKAAPQLNKQPADDLDLDTYIVPENESEPKPGRSSAVSTTNYLLVKKVRFLLWRSPKPDCVAIPLQVLSPPTPRS